MGVPKRMRAVQVVFFLALITIGFALKCQVCQNEGLCMDDDDIGVATECPEDMTGCFYSKSSTVSLLHITFLLFDLLTFASSFRNDEQTEMPKSSSRLLLLLDARRGETNVLLLYN